MRIRGLAIGLGWLAAGLLGWTGMSDAATYQLQVASVPDRVFMYFTEGRTLPRIEAYLDDTRRSKFVLFRDRQPQALEFTGPGQAVSFPVHVTRPKRNDLWGVATWDGEAGRLAVFRIRGIQSDHQKLKRVAVQTDGVLTRLPVRGIPASSSPPLPVPATAETYLVHALQNGTFPAWVDQRAVSYDGLSVVVGRHSNAQQSDTVYLVIRMPQAGQAYKVVLGWENLERRGVNAKGQGSHN